MFSVPWSHFSGGEFWILRYPNAKIEDGVKVYGRPKIIRFPGRIQPIRDLRNVKAVFGDDVSGAVDINTPHDYPLQIYTKNTENDYVYYRGDFYKVEQTLSYNALIPHNEAIATLITHPGALQEDYLPRSLSLNDNGDSLSDGKGNTIIFGLYDDERPF